MFSFLKPRAATQTVAAADVERTYKVYRIDQKIKNIYTKKAKLFWIF